MTDHMKTQTTVTALDVEAAPYGTVYAGFEGGGPGVKIGGPGSRSVLVYYPKNGQAHPLQLNYPHGLRAVYTPEESA